MMKIHENSLNHKETESKELDNYVMFTAYLYTYQVITCDLIFDLMKKFVNEFNIKNIELIILTLRLVGFNLRKDDPSELKSIIVEIQKKSSPSLGGHCCPRCLVTMISKRGEEIAIE